MENIPNAFHRVSAKALVYDSEGRFLMTKENIGKWGFPGGGIDHGETPHQAMKREIKEEMGLELVSMSAQPVYFHVQQDGISFAFAFYEVELANLDFIPSDECVELRFVTKEEALGLNLFPVCITFIEQNL